ncbi:conserved unknown protein [Ectocarpus siliculosus]|uniref:DUF218 domain-containing protein n=1 Tax=Ectocarpus siliculosus TaxID=2880 RepID=D7FPF5_ECTSI|nr:conserved unknown protein [Ectocarpus siliculosus]|eukprot:CBJ30413.1 conserved unknown protein [Ectocarpus siliculosus]
MQRQHQRVAAPEGLRRLLRNEGKTNMTYSRRVEPMYASKPSLVDLEAGGTDLANSKTTAALCRPTMPRLTLAAIVVLLQAAAILGLLVSLALTRDRCRTAAATESFHVGPRVVFVDSQASKELTHLIMVPCHGVTVTESLEGADSRDGDWFLLDYQKGKDVPRALVGHIQGGLDALDADENALLLFSGGKTRGPAGPKSEGESYFFVADHYDWWGKPDLRARASTEDFARDSFENVLFSICRFKEITGDYPTKITVVGFDFKEDRFEHLHMPSLRFPPEAFRYVGLHPEGRFDHAAAAEGERTSALEPYRSDPYGCAVGGTLVQKRHARDPFHRTPPYSMVCPEMSELLGWCETELFTGDLPWSPASEEGTEEGSGVRERLRR